MPEGCNIVAKTSTMAQLIYHKEQQLLKEAIFGGKKKRIAVAAARRCGKSEMLALTMANIAAHSSSNILIYAPTLQQVKHIYRPKFERIFANSGLSILLKGYSKSENEYTFRSGARILLGSAENLVR